MMLGRLRGGSGGSGKVEGGGERFKWLLTRMPGQGYMHMHVYVSTCERTSAGAASVFSTA